DIRIVPFAATATQDEFRALLAREAPVHAVMLGQHKISSPEIEASRELQVIARNGVGFDNIDLKAMTANGVPLMTVGIANSPSVAEAAMHFMLTLIKHGQAQSDLVKQNRWTERMTVLGGDVYGKTVLVVGFGRIGTRFVKRAVAFEMNVLVYDPYVKADTIRAFGAEPAPDLDAALKIADVVTLHCPRTPETNGLINKSRLALMKPNAVLINTARGGIVDETDLHDALSRKVIKAAALDVLDVEPGPPNNPLFKLDNCMFAPHMAGVTAESMDRMSIAAAENALSVFDGTINRANVVNQDVLK
ncbi:MAG: 3-phosphoglycerate dehydrogenase, partial [Hyphomicrobiaceae bacterium]|nr:3-phosphoglycerate dehydrogenase [Hyphomicrobiaceae bacterium]